MRVGDSGCGESWKPMAAGCSDKSNTSGQSERSDWDTLVKRGIRRKTDGSHFGDKP